MLANRRGRLVHETQHESLSPLPPKRGERGVWSRVAVSRYGEPQPPSPPDPLPPKRGERGVWSRSLPPVVACALIVTTFGCNRDSAKSTPATASPSFTIVHPQKQALPKIIEQPGEIRGYESTPLYAKLAGFVKSVNVDIGDSLEGPTDAKPGTVLAELSIPELVDEGKQKEALVDQAQAEVEQAKKQVVIAEANVESANAQIIEAKAGITRAKAMLRYWESEATRVTEMVKNKVVNPQTGSETENQLRAAEASRDEASARVTVAEKAAIKAQAELAKAREDEKAVAAKKRVADAEAARLKSLLEYRFIRAPYNGAVVKRSVDTGKFVQPAGNEKSEALFTVVRLDTVRVPIEVPEADAGLVHKGDPVTIRIPSLRGEEIAAKVSRTSEALDPASRTLRVEIDLKNDDHHLRPGLYVYAKITAPMPEAWTLPANAVVKQAEQMVVFLHKDGKAVRLPVQSGRTDGKFTEVVKKLKQATTNEWEDWTGTEDVLSGPASTLADGQAVQLGK